MDSLVPDYYEAPYAPIQPSRSMHSLAPSESPFHDSADALPPLPIAQPRPSHGSFASLHAAAGLGISHQPTFTSDQPNGHLQVAPGQDSALKERQAYRSTTPVVHGAERFEPSPSPERNGPQQQRYEYPPSGYESPAMSFAYEKPSSIRSVRTQQTTTTRPSAAAPNLRSLGFSEAKPSGQGMSRRKKQFLTIGAVVGVIVAIAIVVPVVYVVNRNNDNAAAAASSAAAEASATGRTGAGPLVLAAQRTSATASTFRRTPPRVIR